MTNVRLANGDLRLVGHRRWALAPHQSPIANRQSRRLRPGVSLVEALIALAITAILLTATTVAIDASFRAYATATEQASTQSSVRLVTHRLLSLVRTSVAHGPLDYGDGSGFTIVGNIITSPWLAMTDASGNLVRLDYHADTHLLTYSVNGGDPQPILGGVTSASFVCIRRRDYASQDNEWVLERATMDLQVKADDDATLAIEGNDLPPVRLVASTMPRRLE